jgi:hypothetical protein
MDRFQRMAVIGLLVPGAWATVAAAEPDIQRVSSRVHREIACIEDVQSRLQQTMKLLRQSERQMQQARDRAVRRDAARAVETLEGRVTELSTELKSCIESSSEAGDQAARHSPRTRRPDTSTEGAGRSRKVARTERTADGRRVVYVEPEGAAAQAVSKPGSATEVLERDHQLTSHVRVQVGELVDGHGKARPSAVRDAVGQLGGRLERCYGRLLDRSALDEGHAILVFTITPGAQVEDVRVEDLQLGDGRFGSCLRSAARALRFATGAEGGEATYSYTLQFGAP